MSEIMEKKFRQYEVDQLAKALKAAIESESEYRLAQACQAMTVFCEFTDPTWEVRNRDAERLRRAANDFARAMDSIDTDAIERFVELGSTE